MNTSYTCDVATQVLERQELREKAATLRQQGLSHRQIGEELGISPKTVNNMRLPARPRKEVKVFTPRETRDPSRIKLRLNELQQRLDEEHHSRLTSMGKEVDRLKILLKEVSKCGGSYYNAKLNRYVCLQHPDIKSLRPKGIHDHIIACHDSLPKTPIKSGVK